MLVLRKDAVSCIGCELLSWGSINWLQNLNGQYHFCYLRHTFSNSKMFLHGQVHNACTSWAADHFTKIQMEKTWPECQCISRHSVSSNHLDALFLFRPFSEEEGLIAIGALHPQEAICSVSYTRGQYLVTKHSIDDWAFPITCPMGEKKRKEKTHPC